MEEKLKSLEGITYKEWKNIQLVIENRFYEMKQNNTLEIDKDIVEELEALT